MKLLTLFLSGVVFGLFESASEDTRYSSVSSNSDSVVYNTVFTPLGVPLAAQTQPAVKKTLEKITTRKTSKPNKIGSCKDDFEVLKTLGSHFLT